MIGMKASRDLRSVVPAMLAAAVLALTPAAAGAQARMQAPAIRRGRLSTACAVPCPNALIGRRHPGGAPRGWPRGPRWVGRRGGRGRGDTGGEGAHAHTHTGPMGRACFFVCCFVCGFTRWHA